MSYPVYKVRDGPVLADPDMPGPRYHTVIFVETQSDGSGFIHHVVGDLVTGMQYEHKPAPLPESSPTFYDKTLMGHVAIAKYPESFEIVLREQRPPPRQKAFNPAMMKTEPMKEDGTFYGTDEARPRLIKCTEWTAEQAIPALQSKGLLT